MDGIAIKMSPHVIHDGEPLILTERIEEEGDEGRGMLRSSRRRHLQIPKDGIHDPKPSLRIEPTQKLDNLGYDMREG